MSKEVVKPSGLRMQEITEGEGQCPQEGQTVSAHYEIYFGVGATSSNYDYDNGVYMDELCDSTYDENNPFSGPVDFVIGQETPKDDLYKKGDSIKGLDEALLDMAVGSKRKLIIPAELAYGSEGASSFHTFFRYRVPPNQALACTIELVGIKDKLERKKEIDSSAPAYEGL